MTQPLFDPLPFGSGMWNTDPPRLEPLPLRPLPNDFFEIRTAHFSSTFMEGKRGKTDHGAPLVQEIVTFAPKRSVWIETSIDAFGNVGDSTFCFDKKRRGPGGMGPE